MSTATSRWLTADEMLTALDMSGEELRWYQRQFHHQLRVLSQHGPDGQVLFSPDAVLLLRSLTGMIAQGATVEQIKGWFGLE